MAGPYYQNSKVDDVDYIEAADLEAIEAGFTGVDADKPDRAIPFTAGDFATLTAAGDLADSGKTPPSGEVVGTTDTQTLTNKTLTSPTINGVSMSGTLSAPSGTWTVGAGVTLSGVVNLTGTWQRSGVTITASAADLNKLAAVTATSSELNKLDGATFSTAEANRLTGSFFTTADLTKLGNVTATSAELNILDGVTATTSEVNHLVGVTSGIQTQINDKASTATTSSLQSQVNLKADAATAATLAGVEMLTNKTITAAKGVATEIITNLDLASADCFYRTITGSTTFTTSNPPDPGKFFAFALELMNGGSATVGWWSGVVWELGEDPTLSIAGTDVLVFWTRNGGATWFGAVYGKTMT